jgi:hypothetical protein
MRDVRTTTVRRQVGLLDHSFVAKAGPSALIGICRSEPQVRIWLADSFRPERTPLK